MTRALPPGDCGRQSSAAGRAPGHRGAVPGVTRLVLGTPFLAGGARLGHRFATGGPRSRRGRLPGVFGLGDNCRAGAPRTRDKAEKPAAAEAGRAVGEALRCYELIR